MRENRTYGSVRGWRRKAPVYSIEYIKSEYRKKIARLQEDKDKLQEENDRLRAELEKIRLGNAGV